MQVGTSVASGELNKRPIIHTLGLSEESVHLSLYTLYLICIELKKPQLSPIMVSLCHLLLFLKFRLSHTYSM